MISPSFGSMEEEWKIRVGLGWLSRLRFGSLKHGVFLLGLVAGVIEGVNRILRPRDKTPTTSGIIDSRACSSVGRATDF